jgi:hypothetical protein
MERCDPWRYILLGLSIEGVMRLAARYIQVREDL